MNIVLRRSEAKDWETIQRLNQEVIENSFQYDEYLNVRDGYTEESTVDYQQTVVDPSKFCLIAEDDGVPVGYIVGGENNHSWRLNKRGEIYHMGVSPAHRGQGIGKQLVDSFKVWCKQRSITHISATTYFNDDKARKFYEKQGMTPIDISLEGEIN